MILKACCICLDSTQMLKKLNSEDKYNIKLLIKLKDVAPKQKWLDVFSICQECDLRLDNAYYFKKRCLRNECLRVKFSSEFSQLSKQTSPTNDCLYLENDFDTETVWIKSELCSEDEETTFASSETSTKVLKNEIFFCFHCKERFKSKHTLKQHLKDVHSNACGQCSKIYVTKKDLQVHMKNNHLDVKSKSTKFQCEVCGEYFSLLKNILEHCSTVHSMNRKDVKPYWCTQCKNKFTSSTLLMQHRKYHNGVRTYICSICGKSFITKRDLSGHEKLHDNQRKYGCGKCNKSFNTSQNLKTHIYVVHTDPSEWKYACAMCLKRFAMKANYSEHVKRHQGNKDYACHICKKTFVSNHEVKKHVKLHSNIAPFKCSECQKNYRDKRSLDFHLSKTHGIGIVKLPVRVKKFVCHVCPSQFFDNHKLQRHIRTHTRVKPYACHGCDKRFVDKSYLSKHLKRVHNIRNSVKVEEYGDFSEENV